jgi:hypothetical protein
MKYRFASNEWFAAFHAILCERARQLAEARSDLSYSICEVLTGVPDDLATMPGGRTAWCATIRGGQVTFEREEHDDVDVKNVADYESVLPLSRFDTQDRAERVAELQATTRTLIAAGKLRITGSPPKGLGPLRSVHDAIARLTA